MTQKRTWILFTAALVIALVFDSGSASAACCPGQPVGSVCITAPDDLLSVGDVIQFEGDPNLCSPTQLPDDYGGCGFPNDCMEFSLCDDCETCDGSPVWILSGKAYFWQYVAEVGSRWEVVAICDNSADSEWGCIVIVECD